MNKQIKYGAMLSYLGIFISIATGLIYTPWMINTIGKSDYGLYTLAMSVIHTFTIDFGLSLAAQRFITKHLAEGKQQEVNNVVGTIYKLYAVITLLILIVFAVLYFFLGNVYVELSLAELEKFKSLFLVAAIHTVLSFPFIPTNGMISAYEKFIQLKLSNLIYNILCVGLTVLALIAGYGVFSLVFVNLIAGLLFTVVRLWIIKKWTPIKPNFKYRDLNLTKELFSFSLWSSVSALVIRFLLSLAPSILGVVSGTAEIAIFGYAVSLESYVYTFVNAINGFFMPKISRISAGDEKEKRADEVTKLMASVGKFILMLFILIFVGILFVGKDFIHLLFGTEYEKSYYCVLLICAYGVVSYPQQIANTYVIVKNKVKKKAIFSLISFALYVALAFVLGKLWGAVGVSIAVFAALSLLTLLSNVLYQKDLGLHIGYFFKHCHLRLLPGTLVFAVASFGVCQIPIGGWVGFAVRVLCMVLVYALCAWFLMLDKDEKYLFRRKGLL